MSEVTEKKSPKKKQEKKVKPKSGLYRAVWAILAAPIRGLTRIHVHGRENEPQEGDGACLVICNHLTWRDPIIMCASLRHYQPHFMAKKELFKIPLLSGLIRALGAYPVNRGGADVSTIRYTIRLLQDGVPVGMFPQGHRYNGEDPKKTEVKKGIALIAMRADVPVLPMYIKVKDNRAKLFCRKDVYIGKPVKVSELGIDLQCAGAHDLVARALFDRVCALGDETADNTSA